MPTWKGSAQYGINHPTLQPEEAALFSQWQNLHNKQDHNAFLTSHNFTEEEATRLWNYWKAINGSPAYSFGIFVEGIAHITSHQRLARLQEEATKERHAPPIFQIPIAAYEQNPEAAIELHPIISSLMHLVNKNPKGTMRATNTAKAAKLLAEANGLGHDQIIDIAAHYGIDRTTWQRLTDTE